MLTLAEIESTQQIEFEARLEALGEAGLRAALTEPARLQALAPPSHLDAAQVRALAETALAQLAAQRPRVAMPAASSQSGTWFDLFASLWTRRR